MTDFSFYKYKVQWYDPDMRETHDLCGITIGENYMDACARLLDFYGGEREVVSFYLEGWDEINCLEMPADILHAVEIEEIKVPAVAPSTDPETTSAAENIPNPLGWYAHVVDHPSCSKFGASPDAIRSSYWYETMVREYGEENIIIEESIYER